MRPIHFMKYTIYPLLLGLFFGHVCAQSKKDSIVIAVDSAGHRTILTLIFGKYPEPHGGIYKTSGGNGPLLSFASMMFNGEPLQNIPRFSWFFNKGTHFNIDYAKDFGIFSGINIKNIGLISKPSDSVKLKQRVYSIGIPLGFKVGDVSGGSFFIFAGGELDFAFNYKEKEFLRGKKKKFNEWFSNRTPILMPSLFAGFRMGPGFGLKAQYYLNNFFNPDFKTTSNRTPVYPYESLKANLFFLTLSYNFNKADYFKDKKPSYYIKIKSRRKEPEVNY